VGETMSRRRLLQLAGAGAVSLGVVPALRLCGPQGVNVTCGISPRRSWEDVGEVIVRPTAAPGDQVLWTTLMRVKDKLDQPLDDWYLWHWTHDSAVCRLYSAPSPRGPYTEHLTKLPAAPANFLPIVGSADVVWDSDTETFYATPECIGMRKSATPGLCTFLFQSFDGRSWSYAKRNPILIPRASTDSWNNSGTSYCRFLRDFSGNLVKVDGKAILYYRGEHDIRPNFGPSYTVGAATSLNLLDWTPVTDTGPLFDPLNGALYGLGSALCKDQQGYYNLVLAARSPDSGRVTMHVKKGRVRDDPFSWDDGTGVLVYDPATAGHKGFDGGSYAIDPVDGQHYMSCGTSSVGGRSVRLLVAS
jgi:hypothetical protein